jgi:hypothetical protein
MANYASNVTSQQFLDSVYGYGVNGSSDPKAAVIPLATFISGTSNPSYSAFLFYNGDNVAPVALSNFSSSVLPQSSSSVAYQSMANYAKQIDLGVSLLHGFKERFWILPTSVDRVALQIIHDTMFDAAKKFSSGLGIYILGLAMMPVPKSFFLASQINGGDPQNVDPNGAPYLWVEESISYQGTLSDEAVDQFYQETNANITSQLRAKGLKTDSFLYLNDANRLQTEAVWQGYPLASIQRLKQIRAKYDPAGIFTDLMPGGWKVADA